MIAIVHVELPQSLCRLAGAPTHVEVSIAGEVTQRAILEALEDRYPSLRGTIRDQTTKLRRPFLRFFACEQDLSHIAPDEPLPHAVAAGIEPFLIIGAIAGG